MTLFECLHNEIPQSSTIEHLFHLDHEVCLELSLD